MNGLGKLFGLILVLMLPVIAHAQTSEEDRGFLQGLLEDNLSDAGRAVRITGFEGALSARATIEELTIADDTGVWFTLRDVVLDWNRSALLRGRLEVAELSAAEVLWPRMPITGESSSPPAPEASGFALPDLPVSVDIDKLSIARAVLGKALFGEAAEVRLSGNAALSGGSGDAALKVERTDGSAGVFDLSGAYDAQSEVLTLGLSVQEAADGIVAKLIGLPGHPSIDLQIAGEGPVDDFAAEIALATDGQERLAGRVAFGPEGGAEAAEPGQTPPPIRFSADIGGDIAPLFAPEYQAFFGPDIRLHVAGRRAADGRLELEAFDLSAAALDLSGELVLGASYWPERFMLTGRLAAADGAEVLLPMSGPRTYLRDGRLVLNFDAAKGDRWVGSAYLQGLRREGVQLDTGMIDGSGAIVSGQGQSLGGADGELRLTLGGLALSDPDLAGAVGEAVTGGLRFDWQEDAPLSLSDITLSGADYGLSGDVALAGLQDDLNIMATGAMDLRAEDLSKFSGLAGMALRGAADLQIEGTAGLLAGTFDMAVTGHARALGLGQPMLDALLDGQSALVIRARRDAAGTWLDQFDLTGAYLQAQANAELQSDASRAAFTLRLPDTTRIEPGLVGETLLQGTARQAGADWTLALSGAGPGQANATLNTVLSLQDGALAQVTGELSAQVAVLAPYSGLAGQDLSGGMALALSGQATPDGAAFDVSADVTGQDLSLGMAQIDRLLRGQSDVSLRASRTGGQEIRITALTAQSPELSARVSGLIGQDSGDVRFEGRLRDIALLADGFSGPVSAEGTAQRAGGDWQVALTGQGPGGIAARVAGQVAPDAQTMALDIAGTAPLALANSAIAPRLAAGLARFDLRLDGPAQLSSLSGTVSTNDGRLSLPNLGNALEGINATVTFAGAQAQTAIGARIASGGALRVDGPIALTPPYNADIAIGLTNVTLAASGLYEAALAGALYARGPLEGGAVIGGELQVESAEIRVASAFGTAGADLEGLVHVNEPAAVRATRLRAGMIETGGTGAATGRPYPLDLRILAPARIFIRGRGLDAEMGGTLQLGGTTANVVPQGRFDLLRGRLALLGKRLELSEGYVSLQGDFEPYIHLVAQAQASSDTTVQVTVDGDTTEPDVTFSSTPERPEDEVLSLLLFGRDLSKISAFQALQLANAVNTLAGRGGSGIVDKLRQGFGFDDLEIVTAEDGTTGARVGKYISDTVYSDVTVGSDGTSEVNLNLTVTPSLTARGSVGSDGDTGIGLFYEKDY